MSKFYKIPEDTFATMQLGAGILLSEFTPASGTYSLENIIGATTGAISFADAVSYEDMGADVNNCPADMKELKRISSRSVTLSGTFVTIDTALCKMLIGAADISDAKVTPRNDLKAEDFSDIWWVGDYSDKTAESGGGFVAIHLMNALSTGGFALSASDDAKGQFAFTFTAHASMASQSVVPYEVYVKAGA